MDLAIKLLYTNHCKVSCILTNGEALKRRKKFHRQVFQRLNCERGRLASKARLQQQGIPTVVLYILGTNPSKSRVNPKQVPMSSEIQRTAATKLERATWRLMMASNSINIGGEKMEYICLSDALGKRTLP